MSETLSDRLDAVERALTEGEADLTDVRERAALSAEVDRLDARIEELEAQLEELDAAVEAVRGYAGNVRAVNRDVERRASAALAKAEALETALEVSGDGPNDADRDPSGSREPAFVDRNRGPEGSESGETRSEPFEFGDGGNGDRGPTPTRADERRDADAHTGAVPAGSTAATTADAADGADDGGTEQFIERIRDAL